MTRFPGRRAGDPEYEAIAAFENVTDAVAILNPALTAAERVRIARVLIEETAHRVRAGEFLIVSLPDKLGHALYNAEAVETRNRDVQAAFREWNEQPHPTQARARRARP